MQSDQCFTCKHYNGLGSCEAFDTIPLKIISGEVSHREPVDGDNGIQWEPIEEE